MLALAAPAVVSAIAARFAQSQKGVVAFRVHRVFDVHAGPSSRHDDVVFKGVYVNGLLVQMHIVSYTIGGKEADTQQAAQFENDWLHPKPSDIFHAPFNPQYLNEYRYQLNGEGVVAFSPLLTDAAHATGTYTYDQRDDLLAYTYTPCVMPQYAKSGMIWDRRAEVLPNYWAVTHETQQYKGHYALWNGGATVDITWTNFRRYPSLGQAEEYIARNR
ncbi:MAG: hypothetical protein JO092_00985 [Candidatus Eremiobacteraeota bacterium]|nr:hypothetical protein [Candidatus Eremiobacteraeota bacterium]